MNPLSILRRFKELKKKFQNKIGKITNDKLLKIKLKSLTLIKMHIAWLVFKDF